MIGRKQRNESKEKTLKQLNKTRHDMCFLKIDEKISELKKLFEEEYNKLKEEYELDIETDEVMLCATKTTIEVQSRAVESYKKAIEFYKKNNKIYEEAIDYCEKVAKDNGLTIECRKELKSKQDELIASYGEFNIQRRVKEPVKKTVKKPVKKPVEKNVKKQVKKPIYALEHIHDLEFEEE